jgi:hypothetical protein
MYKKKEIKFHFNFLSFVDFGFYVTLRYIKISRWLERLLWYLIYFLQGNELTSGPYDFPTTTKVVKIQVEPPPVVSGSSHVVAHMMAIGGLHGR